MKRQLCGVKLKTVKELYVAPFVCDFTNIITLKSSFQEHWVVGYEYVNEKARKEWLSTYEKGDLLWNLKYWYERYVKQYNAQIMRNCRPQCINQIFLCAFISLR